MFKTILLTIFLFFGFTTKVYGDTGEWQIVLQGQLQEPGLDKLIEWVPEEVPRTVTFYFDTDSDGKSQATSVTGIAGGPLLCETNSTRQHTKKFNFGSVVLDKMHFSARSAGAKTLILGRLY